MNIWKKFMSLFSITKEIEITPIETVIEETQSIEVETEEKVEISEVVIEPKPKKKRYYPKKPKTIDTGNKPVESPNKKPKRKPKD